MTVSPYGEITIIFKPLPFSVSSNMFEPYSKVALGSDVPVYAANSAPYDFILTSNDLLSQLSFNLELHGQIEVKVQRPYGVLFVSQYCLQHLLCYSQGADPNWESPHP
jgi:hypothetical protein